MDNWTVPQKLYRIYQYFVEECTKRNVQIKSAKLAHDFIYLLMRDPVDGIELKNLTPCKIMGFIKSAICTLEDTLNPTTASFKLKYFFTACQEVDIDFVKQKYDTEFQNKLQELITCILRYPQTSNTKQIDQMLKHIQIFVIVAYSIGSPKDHVLLKQTRQSLRSVITKADLQDYVMKVRFNRLEYLQRLSATVCGILIYNNQDPKGDKEHMRDILADLELAQRNTKESFETGLKRANEQLQAAIKAIEDNVKLDPEKQMVHLNVQIVKLHRVNHYIVCFSLYKRYIEQLMEKLDKVAYLISVNNDKMKCVIDKINEVLKFRTAIQSELIFPHFAYLSELWTTFNLYFNYLIELNKIKDEMDSYVPAEMDDKLMETIKEAYIQTDIVKIQKDFTFDEIYEKKCDNKIDFNEIKHNLKLYCTLVMSLTDGLLIPAHVVRKQCEHLDIEFGYRDVASAKYALRFFNLYCAPLKCALIHSRDLILLFDLESTLLKDVIWENVKPTERIQEMGTQTRMVITNDLSNSNWVNVTWNIWDYHRETIHLANIRKLQTHSTQTHTSYGQRNAQNQAYYTRKHFGN